MTQITMQNACEPCRRLIAAGCLPGRAGQPTQIMLHMILGQLRGLAGASAAEAAWAGPAAGPGYSGSILVFACGTSPTSAAASRAHQRRLRGLFVDYEDGAVQLPSDVTDPETRQLIDNVEESLSFAAAALAPIIYAPEEARERVKAIVATAFAYQACSSKRTNRRGIGCFLQQGRVSHGFLTFAGYDPACPNPHERKGTRG